MNGCAGLILNAVRTSGHHVVVGVYHFKRRYDPDHVDEGLMRSSCAQIWQGGECVNMGVPRPIIVWQQMPREEALLAMECGITTACEPQYDEDDPWPGILAEEVEF